MQKRNKRLVDLIQGCIEQVQRILSWNIKLSSLTKIIDLQKITLSSKITLQQTLITKRLDIKYKQQQNSEQKITREVSKRTWIPNLVNLGSTHPIPLF